MGQVESDHMDRRTSVIKGPEKVAGGINISKIHPHGECVRLIITDCKL